MITKKPLVVGEVLEKLPSKIRCKICIEKTQEPLKHRKSLAPVNMTKAVWWWLIFKLANANERLQLPPKHTWYLILFFKWLCSTECHQRCHASSMLQRKIQEMYYNGWKADHYVTNVFVFVPDGMIPIAFLMFLVLCMIVRLPNGEEYMTNWNLYTNPMVEFVLLTQYLEKLTVIF